MEIRKAEIQDTEQILRVLDETTLDLHNNGVQQWSYPWDPNVVKKDILNGSCYILLVEETIIGTFSISNIEKLNGMNLQLPGKYLSRIAILPEYQGEGLGGIVTEYAQSISKHQSLLLDCWAGNARLRSFYTDNGFEHIGDFPEHDYLISVFKSIK